MSLPLVNSVEAVVESGWRSRRGEPSEPERARQLDSTAPNGVQPTQSLRIRTDTTSRLMRSLRSS